MSSPDQLMRRAIANAVQARTTAPPNPWVGAALATPDGAIYDGFTQPFGGAHAEVQAIAAARAAGVDDAMLANSTLAATLEPCNHQGKTGPCTEAIIAAGIGTVVVGVEDPDPQVAGTGIARLRDAGIEVISGIETVSITLQLEPYLHHRRTGLPWVVLKLAATLDGRTAAPDGSSQWITGDPARSDAHQLRAESQAILVGAGTVRADDPTLTTRHADGPDPRRVVLGHAPPDAKVHPCTEWDGPIEELLPQLASEGVVQLLVEGGARVAAEFHRRELVDHYVVYVAPALFGGDDAPGLFAGPGAPSMEQLQRGRFVDVRPLGRDLRLDLRLDRRTTLHLVD